MRLVLLDVDQRLSIRLLQRMDFVRLIQLSRLSKLGGEATRVVPVLQFSQIHGPE